MPIEINVRIGGKKKKKKKKNRDGPRKDDDSSSGDDDGDDDGDDGVPGNLATYNTGAGNAAPPAQGNVNAGVTEYQQQVMQQQQMQQQQQQQQQQQMMQQQMMQQQMMQQQQMMGGPGMMQQQMMGGPGMMQQQMMGGPGMMMGGPGMMGMQRPMMGGQLMMMQAQPIPPYMGGYQPPPQLQQVNRLAPFASHTFACDNIIISVDEPTQKVQFDVGIICLDENLQCVESIFFSNKVSRDGSIQHIGSQANPLTGTSEDCLSICFSKMDPRVCYMGICISNFNGFKLGNDLPQGCTVKVYSSQPGQGLTTACQPLFMSEVNSGWPSYIGGNLKVFDQCSSILSLISCGGTQPNVYVAIAESADGRVLTANIDEMQKIIVANTKGAVTVNGVYLKQEAAKAEALRIQQQQSQEQMLKQQQNMIAHQQQLMLEQQKQAQQNAAVAGAIGGAIGGAVVAGAVAIQQGFMPRMPDTPKPSSFSPLTYSINRKISGEIVDQAGNVLMKAGETTMDATGKIVDKAGRIITSTGELLDSVGKKIGKLLPNEIIITIDGRIINKAGDILDQAGRVIGKLLPDEIPGILGDVASALASAGKVVLKAVTGDAAQQILSTLGQIATNLPLIGAVGAAMKVFFDMARLAKYNKLAAEALNTRVTEVGLTLGELMATVNAPSAAMDATIKTLTKSITEAGEFLKQFQERSYLSRLFSGSSDEETVKKFDKQLTDSVQSISMSIGVQQIALQQRTLSELDYMKSITTSKIGTPQADGSHLKAMSKSDIAELARALQIDENEFEDEMQCAMATMLASQQRMEAQQNQMAKLMGVGDLDTMTSDRAKKFWDEWFTKKEVSFNEFSKGFQESYNNGEEIDKFNEKKIKSCIDLYPKDGDVSYIEYRRFFKSIFADGTVPYDSSFNVYKFIQSKC